MIDKDRVKAFFERINFFGYGLVKTKDYLKAQETYVKNLELLNEKGLLEEEVKKLRIVNTSLIESQRKVPIDITIGDPTPIKAGERKTYVDEVAGFHETILHNKLIYMLHRIHLMFEDEDVVDKKSDMLKGVAYAFRELDRWGNLMISEHMGDQEENVSAPDKEEELLEKKDK